MKTQTPISDYPRIVAFTGMHDSGPADPRPNGVCPHCGAEGRYTYFFVCENGEEYGAMSGCLKLFPKTEVAVAHEKLQKKIAEKKKLNGWDEKMLEAIHGFIAKTMSYDDTVSVIRRETASRNAWIARKYRGR